jgi:hypothetical protein
MFWVVLLRQILIKTSCMAVYLKTLLIFSCILYGAQQELLHLALKKILNINIKILIKIGIVWERTLIYH